MVTVLVTVLDTVLEPEAVLDGVGPFDAVRDADKDLQGRVVVM